MTTASTSTGLIAQLNTGAPWAVGIAFGPSEPLASELKAIHALAVRGVSPETLRAVAEWPVSTNFGSYIDSEDGAVYGVVHMYPHEFLCDTEEFHAAWVVATRLVARLPCIVYYADGVTHGSSSGSRYVDATDIDRTLVWDDAVRNAKAGIHTSFLLDTESLNPAAGYSLRLNNVPILELPPRVVRFVQRFARFIPVHIGRRGVGTMSAHYTPPPTPAPRPQPSASTVVSGWCKTIFG